MEIIVGVVFDLSEGKNAWLAEKARRENKGRTAYSRGLRHCPKPHLRRTGVSCDDATRATTGFIHTSVKPFRMISCLPLGRMFENSDGRWIWKI